MTTSHNGYVGDICSFFNSFSSFPVQMAFLASALEEYTLQKAAEKSFQLISMEFFLFPLYISFELTAVRRRVSHSSARHVSSRRSRGAWALRQSWFQRAGFRFQSKVWKRDQGGDDRFDTAEEAQGR